MSDYQPLIEILIFNRYGSIAYPNFIVPKLYIKQTNKLYNININIVTSNIWYNITAIIYNTDTMFLIKPIFPIHGSLNILMKKCGMDKK